MGVRDEEEKEVGRPGEGVRGVAGLEGGNEEGLEVVSSAELSDSLRKWVYLVLGTSSILSISSSVCAKGSLVERSRRLRLAAQSFSWKG